MSIAQKGRATIYYLAHAILILVGCLLLVVEWSDQGRLRAIIDAVGTSMIATGGAGIVLFLYVAREATRLDLINEVESAGVVRILPFRSTKIKDEYDKRIRRAKSIDILGIGLSAFREDYRDELGEIARRAKVRILLLDPTAPSEALSYASQKDREEKNPDGKSAADVREFVNTFGPLKRRGKLEIRTYRSMPSLNIFRTDDEAFWGPYVSGAASRNMPSMIVRRGGYLFSMLEKHFEELWTEATEV